MDKQAKQEAAARRRREEFDSKMKDLQHSKETEYYPSTTAVIAKAVTAAASSVFSTVKGLFSTPAPSVTPPTEIPTVSAEPQESLSWRQNKRNADILVFERKFKDAIDRYSFALTQIESEAPRSSTSLDSAVILANRALCFHELKQFQNAFEDASLAIKTDNSWSRSYIRKAHAAEKLGDLEGALESLNSYIQAEPASVKDAALKLKRELLLSEISNKNQREEQEKKRQEQLIAKQKQQEETQKRKELNKQKAEERQRKLEEEEEMKRVEQQKRLEAERIKKEKEEQERLALEEKRRIEREEEIRKAREEKERLVQERKQKRLDEEQELKRVQEEKKKKRMEFEEAKRQQKILEQEENRKRQQEAAAVTTPKEEVKKKVETAPTAVVDEKPKQRHQPVARKEKLKESIRNELQEDKKQQQPKQHQKPIVKEEKNVVVVVVVETPAVASEIPKKTVDGKPPFSQNDEQPAIVEQKPKKQPKSEKTEKVKHVTPSHSASALSPAQLLQQILSNSEPLDVSVATQKESSVTNENKIAVVTASTATPEKPQERKKSEKSPSSKRVASPTKSSSASSISPAQMMSQILSANESAVVVPVNNTKDEEKTEPEKQEIKKPMLSIDPDPKTGRRLLTPDQRELADKFVASLTAKDGIKTHDDLAFEILMRCFSFKNDEVFEAWITDKYFTQLYVNLRYSYDSAKGTWNVNL